MAIDPSAGSWSSRAPSSVEPLQAHHGLFGIEKMPVMQCVLWREPFRSAPDTDNEVELGPDPSQNPFVVEGRRIGTFHVKTPRHEWGSARRAGALRPITTPPAIRAVSTIWHPGWNTVSDPRSP